MNAAALALLLTALIVTDVSILTSWQRTGSEALIVLITTGLGAILAVGLASWYSGPYRSNKDDAADDP